jgi:hypothetical protein
MDILYYLSGDYLQITNTVWYSGLVRILIHKQQVRNMPALQKLSVMIIDDFGNLVPIAPAKAQCSYFFTQPALPN